MAILQPTQAVVPEVKKKRRAAQEEDTSRTLISNLERSHLSVKIFLWIITGLLVLVALTFLVPFFWFISGAFKAPQELLRFPPTLLPDSWHWENFAQAWDKLNFPLYFFNTVIIMIVGWLLPLAVNLAAAYSLSKLRPSYGQIVLFAFLITLMIPGVVYLIPLYLTVVNLHLNDTWLSLWLPGAFSAYSILIAKAFFDGIPNELSDSAVIDGANVFQILFQIILPLSRPLIVVLSIGALIGGWQQFFPGYLYITDPNLWPIGTAIFSSLRGGNTTQNIRMAALLITAIPPGLFFLVFQRQVIKGVNLSGFMNG